MKRSDKTFTIKRFFKSLFKGSFFILFFTLLGTAFGLGLRKVSIGTTYSMQCVLKTEVTTEDVSIDKYVKLLTTAKGINYINEQLNTNWECEKLPSLTDNKLYKSLSFTNLNEDGTKNSNVILGITYTSSSSKDIYLYTKTIGQASSNYLNSVYSTMDFYVAKYPAEDEMKTNVNKGNSALLVPIGVSFVAGVLFVLLADMFSDTIFFKDDIEEIASDYKCISLKKLDIKSGDFVCYSDNDRKVLAQLAKVKEEDVHLLENNNDKPVAFILGYSKLSDINNLSNGRRIILVKPGLFYVFFFPFDCFWRSSKTK